MDTHFCWLLTSIPWSRAVRINYLDSVCAAAAAKLLQSCPTLCDPIEGSPPGSAVPGILQARTLEKGLLQAFNLLKKKKKAISVKHTKTRSASVCTDTDT